MSRNGTQQTSSSVEWRLHSHNTRWLSLACSHRARRVPDKAPHLTIRKITCYSIPVMFSTRTATEAPPTHAEEGRVWRWHVDFVNFVAIYLSEPFASAVVSIDWRAESLALGALSIYGHLRHANVPSPYLIRALWSPLSSSNRASSAALVQPTPAPPPLIHRLQIPTQLAPQLPQWSD